MHRPFPAYKGEEPYAFVSYAHKDASDVYYELTWLRQSGYKLWYDEGIEAGSEWREELASAIEKASIILFFASPNSAASENCRRELNYGIDQKIPIISVYLEATQFSGGLKMTLSDYQAIFKYETSVGEYQEKLNAGLTTLLGLSPEKKNHIEKRLRFKPVVTSIAVVILVAAGSLLFFLNREPHQTKIPTSVDSIADVKVQKVIFRPENSIAVLPFINMSSDPEQEFFSDGITEEVLNSLASVKGLQVISRTSSFAFKDRNDSMRQIGDALGVKYILEGSVRKSGKLLRITAQLIDVESGFHLWSDTYDRELTNVFAIQDEIAAEILNQLSAKLLQTSVELPKTQTTVFSVYELYLMAKRDIRKRTSVSLESALELLDRAIILDPNYAPAYVQRGIAHLLLTDDEYGRGTSQEALKLAKESFDIALLLDTELAELWTGLGLYYVKSGNNEKAIETLNHAIELNPNQIDANNWLRGALNRIGDHRRLLELVMKVSTIDPLYIPGFNVGVEFLINYGKIDEAQMLIDKFRRFKPDHPALFRGDARIHLSRGELAKASALAEHAYELDPDSGKWMLSAVWQDTLQLKKLAGEANLFSSVYALDILGQREAAYKLAEDFVKRGWPGGLFTLYNKHGRSDDLITYVESRWSSLSAFTTDNPRRNQVGYEEMEELAYAYKIVGNQARFQETLALLKAVISEEVELGVSEGSRARAKAVYFVLTGAEEKAITQLEIASKARVYLFNRHYLLNGGSSAIWGLLPDNPRLKALETAQFEETNRERKKLGLAPVSADMSFWK